MFDCFGKELLVIDSVLDDIVVRQGVGIGFSKGPFCPVDEFFYIRWEFCHDYAPIYFPSLSIILLEIWVGQ